MKQKIITANCYVEFRKQVQEYLDSGWQVIPGTLSSTLSTSEGYSDKERYVVFLQKSRE